MARKQYHIPKGDVKMIYVGIDIAKETNVAAAMDTNGVILLEPFAFQNDHEGFKLLKANLG